MAQTTLTPPAVGGYGAGVQVPAPVQIIGYDSNSSAPCIVGSTTTCVTPGGGGAITAADGAVVTTGAKADAAVTNPASSATVVALLKGLLTDLNTANTAWSYNHITTSTTTTVKGTPGTIYAVVVNSKGTVASTVTVKDGTNVIGVIDSLNNVGTFTFNAAAATSIILVTTGTVAPDVTALYR